MSGGINIQILELDSDHIKFAVYNIDVSIANALRRIIMCEVPCFAVELVSIINNSSVLSDEYISHRLGLVPLISSDVDNYKYTKDCDCKPSDHCELCRVFFKLKIKCVYTETLEVTSKDLEIMYPKMEENEVKPVKFFSLKGEEIGVPICILKRNQELDIECEARKGIGKFHSKWSPVCVATFQHDPIVKINEKINDMTIENKIDFVDCCPAKVFTLNEKTQKVEVTNSEACIFCKECERKVEKTCVGGYTEDYVRVTSRKDKFIFIIETTGSLKPEEIMKKSMRILITKLKEIQSILTSSSTR